MQLWPLEDTVFDRAVAEKLATECYRTHGPGPWAKLGKVQELLEGLWWAEIGHFKAGYFDNGALGHRNLLANLKRKGGFGTKITAAANEWEKLPVEARLYFAEAMKSAGELGDCHEIAKRIDQFMWGCLYTEHLLLKSNEEASRRGPIPQLSGLKNFVYRLRVVWKRNDLGEEFSADFERRVEGDRSVYPVSSAAKLVCASATLLDPRYTPATCESIMRPR